MKFSILSAFFVLASLLSTFRQDGRGKDGYYHDPESGERQPDMCDNTFKNEHKCTCSRTEEDCNAKSKVTPSRICMVYCRPNACRCGAACSS